LSKPLLPYPTSELHSVFPLAGVHFRERGSRATEGEGRSYRSQGQIERMLTRGPRLEKLLEDLTQITPVG